LCENPVGESAIAGVLQHVNRPTLLTEAKSGSPIAVWGAVVVKPTDLNRKVASFTMVVGGHTGG